MTKKHSCKIWLAAVLAVLFAAVLILLMETRGFTYESNDDVVIADMISRGEGWCPYVSKLLTGPLQSIKTDKSAWMIFIIASTAVGVALTVYVLCRSSEIWWLMCLIPMCISVFGIFCREITYTRTAICVCAGGASMLLYGVFGENGKKGERITVCILGALALVLSALIREASAFLGLAFLAVFTVDMLIMYARQLDLEYEWKELVKKGIIMLAAALLCLGAMGVSHLMYTDAEKEFNRFNKARTAVVDYVDNYPAYIYAKDKYDERGISEIDYYLMTSWNFTDTELITTEKYESMGELKQPTGIYERTIIEELSAFVKKGSFTLPLILVLAVFFIKDSKTSVIPTLMGAGAFLLAYFYLYFSGRVVERVTQPALYTAAMLSIVCTLTAKNEEEDEKKQSPLIRFGAAAALVGAVLCCPFAEKIIPDVAEQKLEKRYYEYLDQQDDKIFALFINSVASYTYDPRITDSDNYDNVISMGGWTSRLPEWYDQIQALGIENPYRALFERDDVYATYNRIAHRFLNEHYGDISASKVIMPKSEFSEWNKNYVRYVKHRQPGETVEAYVDTFNEPELDLAHGRRWYITGRADTEPGEIYCNAKCGEKELTFAVTVDEKNRFTGIFYDVPEEFDNNKTEFVFFR